MTHDGASDEATLAVLAGGAGRRMGTPKAWLTLSGQPILARLMQQLRWGGPTMLVTSPGRAHPPGAEMFDVEVIDPLPDQGPLQGIVTALARVETDFLVAIPADMPHVSSRELKWMLGRLRETQGGVGLMMHRLADDEATLEPLPLVLAVRPARTLIEARVAAGTRSLRGLANVPGMHVQQCLPTWPQEFWTNLNRPEDRAAFEAAEEAARS